mgnify:CR=1 FL=1
MSVSGKLLTREEVAQILSCSPPHVDSLEKLGRIPAPINIGLPKKRKMPRWRSSEIEDWAARGFPGNEPDSNLPEFRDVALSLAKFIDEKLAPFVEDLGEYEFDSARFADRVSKQKAGYRELCEEALSALIQCLSEVPVQVSLKA